MVQGSRRHGFEFKHTDAPGTTKSMKIAIQDLGLDTLDVVHAGDETYPLSERVRALALSSVTGLRERPRYYR